MFPTLNKSCLLIPHKADWRGAEFPPFCAKWTWIMLRLRGRGVATPPHSYHTYPLTSDWDLRLRCRIYHCPVVTSFFTNSHVLLQVDLHCWQRFAGL